MLIRLAAFSLFFVSLAPGGQPTRDITFASPNGHDLKLDIFLPNDVDNPPLVVFIHGGGWKGGSYKKCHTKWLVDEGFAVASVSYRLSQIDTFPAQVHDCKAAIRWLRAHADDYGYNATRIGVTGTSAGGHLALMMGATSGDPNMEGKVGGHFDRSSSVHAVVDYYGPSDFLMRSNFQPQKTDEPDGSVYRLIGGPVKENTDIARQASPAFHVDKNDPPLLIIHGTRDKTVRIEQSERMLDVAQAAGVDTQLIRLSGAGHGGVQFWTDENTKPVASFFRKYLAAPKERDQ